jgi:hypothetical protein
VGWGLLGGGVLGLTAVSLRRRTRWTFQVAGFALAGFAVALAGSFVLPNHYVSSAVMRFSPPLDPVRWYGGPEPPLAERLRGLASPILSDPSLEAIVIQPELKLYPDEWGRRPIPELIANLRRDLVIQQMNGWAFRISFKYVDRYKAQRVVRAFVTRFTELNVIQQRERAQNGSPEYRSMAEHKAGENLEVLDPASLPELPVSPNRLAIAGGGMLLGMVAGIYLRRRPAPAALAHGSVPPQAHAV